MFENYFYWEQIALVMQTVFFIASVIVAVLVIKYRSILGCPIEDTIPSGCIIIPALLIGLSTPVWPSVIEHTEHSTGATYESYNGCSLYRYYFPNAEWELRLHCHYCYREIVYLSSLNKQLEGKIEEIIAIKKTFDKDKAPEFIERSNRLKAELELAFNERKKKIDKLWEEYHKANAQLKIVLDDRKLDDIEENMENVRQ